MLLNFLMKRLLAGRVAARRFMFENIHVGFSFVKGFFEKNFILLPNPTDKAMNHSLSRGISRSPFAPQTGHSGSSPSASSKLRPQTLQRKRRVRFSPL